MRHLSDLRAGPRRDRIAGDEGILEGIAAGDSPSPRHIAVQANLIPLGSLAAGLYDARRVVGVRRPRIGAAQTITCRCQRQRPRNVPLKASFVVAELFRL